MVKFKFLSTKQGLAFFLFFMILINAGYSAIYRYWVEENPDGSYMQDGFIWVELNLTAGTPLKFYVYYMGQTNKGDPEGIFYFFDNFNGTGLDSSKWIENYTNYINMSFGNGYMQIVDANKSLDTLWIYDNTDIANQHRAIFTPQNQMIIEWKSRLYTSSTTSEMGEIGVALNTPSNTIEVYNPIFDNNGFGDVYGYGYFLSFIGSTSYNFNSYSINPNEYYRGLIKRDFTDYIISLYQIQNRIQVAQLTGSTSASIDYMSISIGAYEGYPFKQGDIDWLFVRDYDPAFGYSISYGLEESGLWIYNGEQYNKRREITITPNLSKTNWVISLDVNYFNDNNLLITDLDIQEQESQFMFQILIYNNTSAFNYGAGYKIRLIDEAGGFVILNNVTGATVLTADSKGVIKVINASVDFYKPYYVIVYDPNMTIVVKKAVYLKTYNEIWIKDSSISDPLNYKEMAFYTLSLPWILELFVLGFVLMMIKLFKLRGGLLISSFLLMFYLGLISDVFNNVRIIIMIAIALFLFIFALFVIKPRR